MSIHFTTSIAQALEAIGFFSEQQAVHEFPIHEPEELRTDDVLNRYGEAKWAVIELLNNHYAQNDVHYDLYNWLLENKEDEVAYFLNEAGSNCLSHSQYKTPSKFKVWLGKKGFVIGMEQKGKGFSIEEAIQNAGGFFGFFAQSKSIIFFDQRYKARTVFMLVLLGSSSGKGQE